MLSRFSDQLSNVAAKHAVIVRGRGGQYTDWNAPEEGEH